MMGLRLAKDPMQVMLGSLDLTTTLITRTHEYMYLVRHHVRLRTYDHITMSKPNIKDQVALVIGISHGRLNVELYLVL